MVRNVEKEKRKQRMKMGNAEKIEEGDSLDGDSRVVIVISRCIIIPGF